MGEPRNVQERPHGIPFRPAEVEFGRITKIPGLRTPGEKGPAIDRVVEHLSGDLYFPPLPSRCKEGEAAVKLHTYTAAEKKDPFTYECVPWSDIRVRYWRELQFVEARGPGSSSADGETKPRTKGESDF